MRGVYVVVADLTTHCGKQKGSFSLDGSYSESCDGCAGTTFFMARNRR